MTRRIERDVVAEQQVVLAGAVEHVVARTADQEVLPAAADDDVVAGHLGHRRRDQQHPVGGLDPLQLGQRQVGVLDVLDHEAVIAEHDVGVGRRGTALDRARAAALERVAAHGERVGVGPRRGVDARDVEPAGEDVDVDAVVAVDVVDAAQAVDGVVAGSAGEVVADLAAAGSCRCRRRRRR